MTNFKNHFLISMPSVGNNLFYHSVIYITHYSISRGAIGVIINKPLGKNVESIFNNINFKQYDLKWANYPVFLGGPVNMENGFILYPKNHHLDLSDNKHTLEDIAKNGDHKALLLSVGYSAWSSYQLESEIKRNDWLVVPAKWELIFEIDPVNRYAEALKIIGINDSSIIYNAKIIEA